MYIDFRNSRASIFMKGKMGELEEYMLGILGYIRVNI